jgi:hypothetical protein
MKAFLDMCKVDIHYLSLPITDENEVRGSISARLEVASGKRNRVFGVTRMRGFL